MTERLKFKVENDKLSTALNNLKNCISSKIDNQIMKGALFELNGNQLTVAGTDTVLYGKEKVEVETEIEGDVVVEYELLRKLLSDFPNKEITLEIKPEEDDRLELTCDNIDYKIPTYDADMFPQEPALDNTTTFNIEQNKLKEIVKRFIRSASNDDAKLAMKGIYIDINEEDETVNFVSTDGYRLQRKKYEPENLNIEQNITSCIVFPETMNFLKRVLNNTEEKITLEIGENKLKTETDEVIVKSNLINEDRYPQYQAVIPNDNELEGYVELDTNKFKSALSRVKTISKFNNISQVTWEINEEIFKLRPTSGQYSSGEEEISILANQGLDEEQRVIHFNIGYIMDYLKYNQEDKTKIKVAKENGQVVFEEGSLIYILLPLRG